MPALPVLTKNVAFSDVSGLDDRTFHFLCLFSVAHGISVRNPGAEGDDTAVSAIPSSC